ncbi:MAG: cobalt-precorrin 5A hydrolase [Desulfuromonadaceae bacterium]|nr:cobalt-precorrin 5A hydrolase [Desulfuromonadaceae bacterium]MDD2854000.1 cobalt-precorrin 5A hydrolase [Desulfuromonadaceae bacterium]
MRLAVIAITGNGAELARTVSNFFEGAELFVSNRYASYSSSPENIFEPKELRNLLSSIWKAYDGFIFIMATGIVVRMIAKLMESKSSDPAVVVMDEAGKFAISLLSGHLGGANTLAQLCASATGGEAVITTATDVNNLPSFDLLAKEHGWLIDDISRIKILNSLLLDKKEIAVVDTSGQTSGWLNGRGDINFYDTFAEALRSGAAGFLFVTNRELLPEELRDNLLILRPRNLVLGIGCNRGTTSHELEAFLLHHLGHLSLSAKSVACLATIAAKSDEVGLIELSERLAVPLHCFEADELNKINCPSPPSDHAFAAVGATGVAEPSAILASNGGKLLLKKVKNANVTLAVAEIEEKWVSK